MKTVKLALLLAALVCGSVVASSADAHGRRHHGGARVGVFIGGPVYPYYYPRYYYPPAYYPYYYSQPIVVPAPTYYPPTYIEQSAPAAAPAQGSTAYWYYCRDSQTYYPYVKQCASPWQQVVPQSAPPS